jgi:hypothetical protein
MMKTVALRLLSAIGLLLVSAAVVYVYHWKAGLIALAVIAVVGSVLAYVLPGELFRFLVRRVVLGLITIWVIVSLVFVLFYVALPDPARQYAGRAATPEEIQNVKIELGLDKPIPTQYVNFINDDLHGNLRTSFVSGHASVNTTIAQAIPVDISLAVGSALLFILLGISVGVLAARHPRSWLDRGATVFVLTGISMPTFILGLLLRLLLPAYHQPHRDIPAGWHVRPIPPEFWVGIAHRPNSGNCRCPWVGDLHSHADALGVFCFVWGWHLYFSGLRLQLGRGSSLGTRPCTTLDNAGDDHRRNLFKALAQLST